MKQTAFWLLLIAVLLLSGCASLPIPAGTTAPGVTPTAEPSPTPTPPLALPPPTGPITIRIWVPPQFDPGANTPAGDLMQAHLAKFTELNPRVAVEVRVKAPSGNGGLLSSLTASQAAAEKTLPDLIALRRTDLEVAAIKGLIHPLDNLTNVADAEDWYDYALQLAKLENNTFGLPFAGDAKILIYRPALIGDPPKDWQSALEVVEPLTFAAASPDALFTLALYQASGGVNQDEQGRPFLEEDTLTDVLVFYQSARDTGLMPDWLSQHTSDELALQAYRENRAHMAIAWASHYLQELPVDSAAAIIPTEAGDPYTLADGWAWALSSPVEDRWEVSTQLAQYLTDSQFLGPWTAAAGYLPPHSAALAEWPASPLQALVSQVVLSAQVLPPVEVMNSIGPALQQATIQVLRSEVAPSSAAREAVARLGIP